MPHARREGDHTLTADALAWPTPAHRDHKGNNGEAHRKNKERPHEDQLPNAVVMWATPNTARRGAETEEARKSRNKGVAGAAETSSQAISFPSMPPAEMTIGLGELLQNWPRPSCPQLNEAFQWWLMGWPRLDRTFSESAATEWSRWRLRLRSSLRGLMPLLAPADLEVKA